MSDMHTPAADVARRRVLGAATAALGLGATAVLLPTTASAREAASTDGIRSLTPSVDTSHATPELARLVSQFFEAKTSRDVEATLSYFYPKSTTYIDATLGWPTYSWQELHKLFSGLMPNWPATARSYPTKILGDTTSALVFFTDTPELFGHEIRPMGVINFKDGKIARWIDYWDGREFTLADIKAQRTPEEQFPTDFKESIVGETAKPALKRVATRISEVLKSGAEREAASLFSDDAVLEDQALRTVVTGRLNIGAYLERAAPDLPYGPGAEVRHVVGGQFGGGYEWTRRSGPIKRGVTALELDRDGRISRFTSVWDGSLLSDNRLSRMQALAIEH
jgi:limonene-1,2-epoxide hydrolase